MKFGKKYVRRCYNRFKRTYFSDHAMPDFNDLDFEFEEAPNEWGSVEWDDDGLPKLTLHPITKLYAAALKETLLHECIHIALGSKYGHGPKFWKEADRIMGMRAHKEFFG